MKVLKKLLQIIIWIVVILVLIYNLYTYISINILKKDLASVNGYAILEVVSYSMTPTINKGDLIIINEKDSEYKKNDIITFKDSTGSIVTHRIFDITSKGIITKGDANNTEDKGFLQEKNIVGKYVGKINNLGYLIKSIRNPLVLILILIMGIIVCVLISTDKNGIPLDATPEEKKSLLIKKKDKERR
ncbi:MAG: signal peptidase I [Bacilli bacterium]|nr:signal peptidase I [Bacilli bacterium]